MSGAQATIGPCWQLPTLVSSEQTAAPPDPVRPHSTAQMPSVALRLCCKNLTGLPTPHAVWFSRCSHGDPLRSSTFDHTGSDLRLSSALGGTRTPNLLIRSRAQRVDSCRGTPSEEHKVSVVVGRCRTLASVLAASLAARVTSLLAYPATVLGLAQPNSVSLYRRRYPDMPRPVVGLAPKRPHALASRRLRGLGQTSAHREARMTTFCALP